MGKIIELQDVTKIYERSKEEYLRVLEDINLNIEEGEFVCILGPSGSGKSTILRMIAGLEQPTTGRIDNKKQDSMAMVFQEYSLFPWRNVIDNVIFPLEIQGINKKESYKKARIMLERMDLLTFKDARPKELSGGMKQRVAIAKALINSPEIILMDEPFGALDPQTRFFMQEDIVELYIKNKKTIIFVTHSVEEAILLGTKVLVLSKRPGRIKHIEDIKMPYPRNKYSESFRKHIESLNSKLSWDRLE